MMLQRLFVQRPPPFLLLRLRLRLFQQRLLLFVLDVLALHVRKHLVIEGCELEVRFCSRGAVLVRRFSQPHPQIHALSKHFRHDGGAFGTGREVGVHGQGPRPQHAILRRGVRPLAKVIVQNLHKICRLVNLSISSLSMHTKRQL